MILAASPGLRSAGTSALLLADAGVGEVGVDVVQPGAGEDALPAHVAAEGVGLLGPQVAEQAVLQLVARAETGVAAFGGDGAVDPPVPQQPGHAQAGAGRDDRPVADVVLALLEHEDVLRRDRVDPRGVGGQVVDDPDRPGGHADGLGQFVLLQRPGEVGRLDPEPPVDRLDRPGHAEAGLGKSLAARAELADISGHDLFERAEFRAGEFLDVLGFPVGVEQGQPGVGAADVASENHEATFLSPGARERPGPGVPARKGMRTPPGRQPGGIPREARRYHRTNLSRIFHHGAHGAHGGKKAKELRPINRGLLRNSHCPHLPTSPPPHLPTAPWSPW